MRRFLCIVITLVVTHLGPAGAEEPENAPDPDSLYANREQLQSALDAAAIWESRFKSDPKDFESAWKLARACYWLGTSLSEKERHPQFERGIKAARSASKLRADLPEGHFWLAANLGGLAESSPWYVAARHAGTVKKTLEKVLEDHPKFQQGSANRGLGRWNFKMGERLGDSYYKESVKHLLKSLEHDPNSIASHYFLAETYRGMKNRDAARKEAEMVLKLDVSDAWAPEDRKFKEKAQVLRDSL